MPFINEISIVLYANRIISPSITLRHEDVVCIDSDYFVMHGFYPCARKYWKVVFVDTGLNYIVYIRKRSNMIYHVVTFTVSRKKILRSGV